MLEHQRRVREFMVKAGQTVRDKPEIPPLEERIRVCKLVLEEARELFHAYGIDFQDMKSGDFLLSMNLNACLGHPEPNLVKIADAHADLSVVNMSGVNASGLDSERLFKLVDENNLSKFEPPTCTGCGLLREWVPYAEVWKCRNPNCPDYFHAWPKEAGPYRREDGKWIKPPYWQAPDIESAL